MPKRKPSQRRHPEQTPQQPRDRLAEIRAEIQDVQQQIETKRRDRHVIRTAEDFKSLERRDLRGPHFQGRDDGRELCSFTLTEMPVSMFWTLISNPMSMTTCDMRHATIVCLK